MALKVQSTIDYIFAFGLSFFLTLLVFGVVLNSPGVSGNSMIYYLAVALIVYSLEFFFVLKFLGFTEKFEKPAKKKRS